MPKPVRVPKTPKSGAGLERNQVPLSAEITCRFQPKSGAGLLRFLQPEETACPCCGGTMHVIGEDRSQRLDVIPAQYRVIVTRRPKYACRACQEAVVEAPAPARLIEGGLPTERLVAHVVVAKYADHCPLYRQAQILARQGIANRSGNPGLLDWLRRSRGQTGVAADARRAAALDQALRRRDHGTGTRPRAGADQKGLLLGRLPATTGRGKAERRRRWCTITRRGAVGITPRRY